MVQYKDRDAPTGSMTITVKIAFVVYVTVPVYVAAVEFYRPRPFHFDTTGVGYILMSVLVVLTYTDYLNLKRSRNRGLHPWFSFLQICVAIGVVITINLTAGGTVATYYVLFLLPLMIAAVMGNLTMIGATWVLSVGALGLVIYAKGNHAADSLIWTLAVHGAAWGGGAMAIDFAVKQFLLAIRTAQTVSKLASAAQHVDEWPDGLTPCMPLLAQIMDAEHVTVMAGPTGSRLEPVASLDLRTGDTHGTPALTTDEQAEGVRTATDSNRVSWVGRSTFVPNQTASRIDIVIVGTRRRIHSLPDSSVTNAEVAGQLVAGIVDRTSLIGGLREEATTDPLTGLANRRGMMQLLDRMLGHSSRTGEPFSLVMLDIDRFKQFNDDHGHLAGDAALRSLAAKLRSGVRQQDVVSRFGGEEFCLLLPSTDRAGARTLVDQLMQASPAAHHYQGVALPTFSAGIAEWDGNESRHDLFLRADTALYQAKNAGRNTVFIAASAGGHPDRGWSRTAAEQQPGGGPEDRDDHHHLDSEPDQPSDDVEQGEGHHDGHHAEPDQEDAVEKAETDTP
jgi:diguanylate cyclase (GGDEF)-like protein